MRNIVLLCFVLAVVFLPDETSSQGPPRLNIPGALLADGPGPRPRRIQQSFGPQVKRKPIPNAIPIPPRESIRPVIEDEAEDRPSILDGEVARLEFSALNSVRQQDDEQEEPARPTFRPVPITRQDLRDSPPPRIQQVRQEAPRPLPRPAAQVRQHTVREQPARPKHAPPFVEDEEDRLRRRRPQVQILRKYRTDNEDGSITWGFENEDGTFKEETIGIDCIIRGKYGYVDPEGERREYTYEAGNKCDEPEEEELELEVRPQNLPRPLARGENAPPLKPQFRPQYKPLP